MSQFPRAEAEIAALALVVIEGLEKAADDFPNPPVPVAELRAKLDAFNTANTGAIAADTAAEGQHIVKDDALEDLAHSVRVDLKDEREVTFPLAVAREPAAAWARAVRAPDRSN